MQTLAFIDPYEAWAAVREGSLLHAFLGIFIVCFIFINFVAVYAGLSTLVERKLAAWMQARVGPWRVGPHGLLQWAADALKLLLKEDVVAKDADKFLFKLAPFIVLGGAFACWVAMPYAPNWSPASFNIGILYLLAVSSAVVIGILMAGWASGSKWALFGAMRSAAQIVSYEVPVGMTLLAMLLIYGSLDMHEIIRQQQQGFLFGLFDATTRNPVEGGAFSWGVFRHPPFTVIAFLIYYIGALAETNRTPFDIPEAESELVAGYHTEYSGMRFSFFFLAEYANMFVVSAIATTFFLGGWLPPWTNSTTLVYSAVGGAAGVLFGYMARRRAWDAVLAAGAMGGLGVLVGILKTQAAGPQPIFFGVTIESPVLVFLEGTFWFSSKVLFLLFIMIWLRWTLPRYRVDQLMDLCWKKLTPLAFVNLAAIGILETRPQWMAALFGVGAR